MIVPMDATLCVCRFVAAVYEPAMRLAGWVPSDLRVHRGHGLRGCTACSGKGWYR